LADVYRGRATDRRAQLVWQQTVEAIFQLQSAVPNWFRLTRALALAATANGARLTTSLMDNPLVAANVRTRRIRLCGSFTVVQFIRGG
jgi:hypothetical protein